MFLAVRLIFSTSLLASVAHGIRFGVTGAAKPKEFPFFISLDYNGTIGCGGTLLSPTRVVTAAHCVLDGAELNVPSGIRIGHTTHSNGETYGVSCVSIHPANVPILGLHDIAIVKLSSPVQKIKTFASLNKQEKYPSASGQALTALGFGNTTFLKKITETHVKEPFEGAKFDCQSSGFICTKPAGRGMSPGDSGGPLLDSNKRQVGVASLMVGGDNLGLDSVMDVEGLAKVQQQMNRLHLFTAVAPRVDWIEKELLSDHCTTPDDVPMAKVTKAFEQAGEVLLQAFKDLADVLDNDESMKKLLEALG